MSDLIHTVAFVYVVQTIIFSLIWWKKYGAGKDSIPMAAFILPNIILVGVVGLEYTRRFINFLRGKYGV